MTKGTSWNEKIDIWSMGCTLYYLNTREQLVPHQTRERASERALNSIQEWKWKTGELQSFVPTIAFRSISGDVHLRGTTIVFRLLMNNMLAYSPSGRMSVDSLLSALSISRCGYIVRSSVSPKARVYHVHRTVKDVVTKICTNNTIVDIALSIYSRIGTSVAMPELLKIETCSWIAHKLVTGITPECNKLKSQPYQLCSAELKICEYLGYVLHT
jgi:serine/threonine protein kinase